VRVDPTFYRSDDGEDDTYVMSGFNRDNAYDTELKVGTYDGGAHVGRSYMNFDVGPLAGKAIDSATFYAYTLHSWSCSARPMSLYRVTQGWAGHSMTTWPGAGLGERVAGASFAAGYEAGGCGDAWASFDVAGAVRNWTSGAWPGFGLAMAADNEADNYAWKKFGSMNWAGTGGGNPHIDVLWSDPPRPPNAPDMPSPVNEAVLADNRPAVWARGSDPNGDNAALRFRLHRDGPNGAYVAGKDGEAVCNGCSDVLRSPISPPAHKWSSAPGSSYWENYKTAEGDYNADGKDDVGIFYNYGGGHTAFFAMYSTASGFTAPVHQWASAPGSSYWENYKTTDGDYNGDNRDDVGIFYNYGGGHTAFFAMYSTASGFTAPVHQWASAPGSSYWENYKVFDGDFTGDGKADVGLFYNWGGGTTSLYWFASTVGGFSPPALAWTSCGGCSYWENYKVADGDFNADAKADVAVFYNHGGGNTSLYPFSSTGGGFNPPTLAWTSCGGCSWWENYKLAGGDFDADAKADIAVFYNYGGGATSLFAMNATDPGALADGRYWWQAWARDASFDSAHSSFYFTVDATAPPPPQLSVRWTSSDAPSFTWSANDTSGINAYSYVLDRAGATTVDTTSEGTATTKAYTGLAPGSWWFHVRARNGAGLWGDTAHLRIQVGNNPYGALDAATPSAGAVDVRGWAIDPDSREPIDVEVKVDGASAGVVRASENRPDIAASYPDYGAKHGYSLLVHASAGNHRVCAYGLNVGPGANAELGCRDVEVTAGVTEGLGQRRSYAFEDFSLSDRLSAQVNVSSGNLLLSATDLTLAGTGIDLGIGHPYNSRSDQANAAGSGWSLSTGSGVFLESRPDGAKLLHAPTGAIIAFVPDGAGGLRAPPDYDATLAATAQGHVLTMTGDKSRFDFDGSGRAVAQKDANNNTISFAYDGAGQLATITDSRGRQVAFTYEAGRIKTMDDTATGRRFEYTYEAGRLRTITSPPAPTGAVVTSFEYDPATANLIAVVDPEGRRTTISYTADDKVASLTRAGPDPRPRTAFAYHPKGAQACIDSGLGNANPCTRIIDPRGNVTSYRLDAQGNHRVEKVKDALGHERSTQYNSSGNVIDHTDAMGAVSTLEYDTSGHNVTASKLPTGASSTYAYDDAANTRQATGVTDPQGNARSFAYDASGNPTSLKANGESQEYYRLEYNTEAGKAGTLRSATDPDAKRTTFAYNARGERTGVDHPAPLGDESFTYGAASRVATHTDGANKATTYAYDSYDRVVKATYGDGSVISYTYDRAGNRRSMADNTGTTTYDYDELNRVKAERLPGLRTNTYAYDAAGNLEAYTDAAGTVTYAHNAVNLVERLTEPGGQVTTFDYDDANRRRFVRYPTGVVQESGYDSSGRVKTIKATKGPATLTDFGYEYNKDNKDTSLRQWVEDKVVGERSSYTYDGLNRLTRAAATTMSSGSQAHQWEYRYDRRSNRTCQSADGARTHYAYNDASQLTATGPTADCATAAASPTTYSYDPSGNQTANSAGQALTYNAKDQTTSITPPGASRTDYDYTGATEDDRVKAGATNFTNSLLGPSYAYQGLLPLPISTTAWTRDDGGVLVGQRSPDTGADPDLDPDRHYYLFDGLGSVVALTDQAGNVVNRYRYDPYGKPMAGTIEAVANPWQYAAGYRDAETGFTKFGARYYDPSVGRWTQQDPSGMDSNLYAYVGGDPVNFVDPSGYFKILSWAKKVYAAQWLGCYLHKSLPKDDDNKWGDDTADMINCLNPASGWTGNLIKTRDDPKGIIEPRTQDDA